jgi:hypothetical protein
MRALAADQAVLNANESPILIRPEESPKPTFAVPQSYLKHLKVSTASPSLRTSAAKSSNDSAATLEISQSPSLEGKPAGVYPPLVSPGDNPISEQTASKTHSTPLTAMDQSTAQRFTGKRRKFKLKEASINDSGGLNNKWLELQERQQLQESTFETAGSFPLRIY